MRKVMIVMLLGLLLGASAQVWAAVPVGMLNDLMKYAGPVRHQGNLDEQCTANFLGFTYGTYSGSEVWPGGNGTYYMTEYMVSTTCEDQDTTLCYCIDLDHVLQHGPYCVNIDPIQVRTNHPEQYPAMAYMLAWYPVTNAAEDRIQQLALWKMSNDNRSNSPTHGDPWYSINGGRGYPDPNGAPAYPYVNTVFNSEPTVNGPASDRVLDAIGYGDGIAKNVALCDDQFTIAAGDRVVISPDSAMVPVTVQLVRGATAISVDNTSLSGVKVLMSVSGGHLSAAVGFTDGDGQVHVTITQAIHSTADVDFQVCTTGAWIKSITPCEGCANQQFVTVTTCPLCVMQTIPGDDWLPVELASFSASALESRIDLTWRTASESNLSHWEIERSEVGSAYATIASIAAENSATGHDYRYSDATVQRGLSYSYRLVDISVNGQRTVHDGMVRTASLPAVGVTAQGYELSSNYPNPFNPETTIRFALAESGHVSLKVYDITGHEVATLVDSKLAAGEHNVNFRAGNLPSGVYFYKLTTGSFSATRKMVLAK